MSRWVAVYTAKGCGPGTGGQGYVLDRENWFGFWCDHLKPWQVVSEHDTEHAAWGAVRQAIRQHDPGSIFIDEF